MRALIAYFLLAFGISWGGILAQTASTGLPHAGPAPSSLTLAVFGAMLAGPSIASLVLTSILSGRKGLADLGMRLTRWHGPHAALLAAPGLLCGVLILLSFASPSFLPAWPPKVAFALIAGLGAGFFEELGWTGFATPRMLERYGVARTGIALGVIWAVWHGLADFWGGASWGSLWLPHFLQWVVALTAFRLLMTWVYDRAHSLLLGMAMHATFTGSQALLWPSAPPAQELIWYGLFAAALWVVAASVALRAPRLRHA